MNLPFRLTFLVLILLAPVGTVFGWQDDDTDGGLKVELGFDGVWKLGHVTPLRVELPVGIDGEDAEAILVNTVDGDGIGVSYRNAIDMESDANGAWSYFRTGRSQTEFSVSVVDASGQILAGAEFPTVSALDSEQPLVVALGSSMGIEELSRTSTETDKQNFTTAVISDVKQLPDSWRSLSSCDLLLLSCHDEAFLRAISNDQWEAIDNWIRRGGGCILSLNGRLDPSVYELDGLKDLLPGKVVGKSTLSDPGLLESLVGTDQPLPSLPAIQVEIARGKAELTMRDSLAKDVPWWVGFSHGHGTVQLVASDLAGDSLDSWKDRKLLWQRLLNDYFEATILDNTTTEKEASDSSYLGYSDLVGQLRATLDVFDTVQSVSFGQVAIALIAVLLLVGPLDYFVSVRWLKRPDLSWYFSGFLLAAVSVGLVVLYQKIRPDVGLINSAQIIDIDTSSGRLQGRIWSHVYSGNAHRFDLRCQSQSGEPVYLDWQGLPGRGLGGLMSQLNTDRGIPPYEIEVADGAAKLNAAGIPAGGTKCLVGTWTAELDLEQGSTLSEIPGVDQLTGELVNPLDVDIRDAMLFYHNWFYRLNSRIPPGGTYSIAFDTIPKDSARRLNGRQSIDGSDTITRWNPADRNSIDRLLELMMFHKAASGRSYTSLSHRYQPRVDQSNLVETDKALLIGWLDEPRATVEAEVSDDSGIEIQQAKNRTWCRIAIPVSKPKSNR